MKAPGCDLNRVDPASVETKDGSYENRKRGCARCKAGVETRLVVGSTAIRAD